MRKALLISCLLLLPAVAGCSLADMIFAVFGDSYSGGGPTAADKRYDFDSRVEASQAHGAAGVGR